MEQTLEDRLRARLKSAAKQGEEEGRERVRSAGQEYGAGDFADIMRRTVEMATEHIGRKTLAERHRTVSGIVLDLQGEKYSVGISADGDSEFLEGAIEGSRVLTIRTSKSVFHNMAYNKLNPGIAYAKGDVKLEGIPILRLRGMDSLITSIFRGYRAASEGLEFEDVEAVEEGGILEEMLGIVLAAFDELLKVFDRVFGVFGAKYFYEKSLNRIEWVWEILDREVRKAVVFGREGAEEGEAAVKRAAPFKSFQERLRGVVETAVAEVSRMAVSGYLIKRLIVPGSFRNFEGEGEVKGFEVRLKNKLGVATVIGFTDIKIDGEVYTLDRIEITKSGKTFPATEISDRRPLSVSFGDELLIRVRRPGGIEKGRHHIELGVDMVGLGGVDVDYEEKLSA